MFILERKIKQRLFPYESRSVPRLATLLNPKFKKEGFRSIQNGSQACILLENELAEIITVLALKAKDNTEESSTSHNSEIPEIYEFLKEKLSNKVKSNRADAIIELREYIEKPNEPLDSDPLEHWGTKPKEKKTHSNAGSEIFTYICIPATSTESERLFSKAGQVISERRTRLKEKHVNMLLFVNKNHWIVN